MFSAESFPGPEWPEPLVEFAEAGHYATLAQGFEHGLVVLSLGWPYWLDETPDGCALRVEAHRAAVVRRELDAYDRESVSWPPVVPTPPTASARGTWATALVWAIAVLVTYQAQLAWPGRLEQAGALDPEAIWGRGEWWRAGTALFLHADLSHLLGNLAIGFFIVAATIHSFGQVLRGWGWLIVSAVMANLVTAAVHARDHSWSYGASTAIFSAIGLLTGRSVRAGWGSPRLIRLRSVLLPLSAGVMLLGLIGSGDGPRVDIVAHAAGFFAGLVGGLMAAPRATLAR